jgi:hypothetical protein
MTWSPFLIGVPGSGTVGAPKFQPLLVLFVASSPVAAPAALGQTCKRRRSKALTLGFHNTTAQIPRRGTRLSSREQQSEGRAITIYT